MSWFEQAVDPDRVASELRRAVPELGPHRSARPMSSDPGTTEVVGCRMIRLRAADPEGHWTATYLVDVQRSGGERETISAHGTLIPPEATDPHASSSRSFGSDGWQWWLPDSRVLLQTWSADDALPGLAALTDRETGRTLVEGLLRTSSPDRRDLALRSVTSTVASYKPGVRVTLVCDLEYDRVDPPVSWPTTVVAKAHLGQEGAEVYDAQRALWASPLATSAVVAIAEPLGYLPDLGLSVQTYLPHDRTLKDLLAEAFTVAGAAETGPLPSVRATARAVAAVHTSGVGFGDLHTWEEELAGQRAKHDKLAAAVPWLAAMTAGVADRLEAAGAATSADPPGPSHGSFRTAQVVLTGHRAGIIDFDKLRQAEPAADLGPFLAKLRHTAVNKGDEPRSSDEALQQRCDEIHEEFVVTYGRDAPISSERLACWEALEHFSLVLGSAKKGLPERAASCAAMMTRHLRAHRM